MSEDHKNASSSTRDKRKIVINLDQKDSESVNPDFIIQIDAMERIQCLINEFAQKDKNPQTYPEDFFDKKRFNNSILLHGQRGYGKTTFAKSIMNKFHAEKGEVYPLAFIDPTLIKSNENLLIHIIEALVTNVKRSLNHCCNNQKYQDSFKNALSAVSDGLRSLSQPPSDHVWILNNALNQVHSDRNLENSINELFKASAEILKKELFLIVLDDVDTNTEKAYDVLEIIRCYMSSPYVCTIAIGDISLYRYIILRKKSDELSPRSMDKFHKIQDKFELLSKNLEEQYFFKMFDASRQVSISRLDQITSDKRNEVYFKVSQNKKEIEVRQLLGDIFKKTSNLPIEKRESYLEFFLSLPLRTIFQLFYNVFKDSTPYDKNNFYQINNLQFVENLEKSFELGDIFDIKGDFYRFSISCLFFYIDEGKLKDCVCGYLIDNDIDYNIKNLYISSRLKCSGGQNKKINAFENFTCYMICVCAGFYLQSAQIKENQDLSLFSLKKNNGLMDFSASISLIASNLNNNDQKNFGIFRILKRQRNFEEATSDSFLTHLNKLFSKNPENNLENTNLEQMRSVSEINFTDFEKITEKSEVKQSDFFTKAFMALYAFRSSCVRNKSTKGELDYFSIINLISFLSKISTCENLTSESIIDLVSDFDFGWSDFFYSIDTSTNSLNLNQISKQAEQRQVYANLYLGSWIPEKDKDFGFSQILAGKIWRRFFEACSTVVVSEKDYVGVVLQRFIVAFINASLIEEFNWGGISEICDREKIGYMFHAKNPNKSFTTLRSNFSTILGLCNKKNVDFSIPENFPFTISLLRSPIISQFIAYGISSNIKDNDGIRGVIKAFLNDDKCYNMLYNEEAVQSSRLVLMYISLLMVQG